jgi:hypothetical protein
MLGGREFSNGSEQEQGARLRVISVLSPCATGGSPARTRRTVPAVVNVRWTLRLGAASERGRPMLGGREFSNGSEQEQGARLRVISVLSPCATGGSPARTRRTVPAVVNVRWTLRLGVASERGRPMLGGREFSNGSEQQCRAGMKSSGRGRSPQPGCVEPKPGTVTGIDLHTHSDPTSHLCRQALARLSFSPRKWPSPRRRHLEVFDRAGLSFPAPSTLPIYSKCFASSWSCTDSAGQYPEHTRFKRDSRTTQLCCGLRSTHLSGEVVGDSRQDSCFLPHSPRPCRREGRFDGLIFFTRS